MGIESGDLHVTRVTITEFHIYILYYNKWTDKQFCAAQCLAACQQTNSCT